MRARVCVKVAKNSASGALARAAIFSNSRNERELARGLDRRERCTAEIWKVVARKGTKREAADEIAPARLRGA